MCSKSCRAKEGPMNTGESLNYIEMVTHSGVVVAGVLLIAVVSTSGGRTTSARRWLRWRRAGGHSTQFPGTFWRSTRLGRICSAAEKLPFSPVAQVFRAGYVEL